jgi:diacylglycerol kinase (ATP)
VLGILPIGTANDLAHQTGLGTIEAALYAMRVGEQRRLDAIEVQAAGMVMGPRTHALVYAAAGVAGDVLSRTTPFIKRWFGRRGAYSVGFLRAWWGLRAAELRVVCDGAPHSGRYLLAAAGNAPSAGGGAMRLSPGAELDDGWFEVTLAQEMGRLALLRCFLHLLKGTHPGQPGIGYHRGQALDIDAPRTVAVQADGEILGHSPARFRIRPGALRLLAPR